MDRVRCSWAGEDPHMIAYHDMEWGVPVHDDRLLFEFLLLEGAQAGLSWRTVLNKREAYRSAFHKFDPERIARMSEEELASLHNNPAIIRNRLKIAAFRQNARAFLKIQELHGSFAAFIWQFVGGASKDGARHEMSAIPTTSPEAEAMSKALQKSGFTFVGPTICYAFMQATGMVNDHLLSCFRHGEIANGGRML
jgi:DNA-3-methyladenine glycosylase I